MTESTVSKPARSRFGWVVIPVVIFAALAALFSFALSTGDPSKLPSALLGKPVPQFTLAGLDGLNREGQAVPGVSNGDLAKGSVSVVNFWASWCVPCVEEHPLLIRGRVDDRDC